MVPGSPSGARGGPRGGARDPSGVAILVGPRNLTDRPTAAIAGHRKAHRRRVGAPIRRTIDRRRRVIAAVRVIGQLPREEDPSGARIVGRIARQAGATGRAAAASTKIAIVFRTIIFARAAVVEIAKDMTTMKFLILRLLHEDANVCVGRGDMRCCLNNPDKVGRLQNLEYQKM